MDKVLALLAMTELRLSAEEKYFLIRLLCVYDYKGLCLKAKVDRTILQLETLLGMSDNLIKKTRESLIAKEYLSPCPIPSQSETKRGRPRAGFFLSQMMIDVLNKSKAHTINVDHIPRIKRLLMWDAAEEKKEESAHIAHLTPANRIVLALMYSRANGCGAIHDLGVMQLAKLSGLKTKDRTESQLEKLTQLGYILDRVSGVTGKYFLGNVKGEFFLNVFNDHLCSGIKSPNLILLSYDFNCPYTQNWAADKLFFHSRVRVNKNSINRTQLTALDFHSTLMGQSVNSLIFNKKLEWMPTIEMQKCTWCSYLNDEADFVKNTILDHQLLPFLLDKSLITVQLRKLLQHKIHHYASVLLSEDWDGITPIFSIIQPCFNNLSIELLSEKNKINLQTICDDLILHPIKFEELNSTDAVDDLKNNLIEFFILCTYRLVFETAILSKGLLEWIFKDEAVDFKKATYSILSTGYTGNKRMENFGIIANFHHKKIDTPYITLNVLRDKTIVDKHRDLSFLRSAHGEDFAFYVNEK